jgi:hypothetical protein
MMVALTLFLMIGGVIAGMIVWGLNSHRKGEAAREAVRVCREVLDRMAEELRTAAAFPSMGILTSKPPFPSAVVWPDSYPIQSGALGTGHFDVGVRGNSYVARNRLIFTRLQTNLTAITGGQKVTDYVYVVYEVPIVQEGGLQKKNRLVRSLFRVTQGADGVASGVSADAGNKWAAVTDYFFTDANGTLNSTGGNMLPQTDSLEEQVVAELPGPYDTIEFEVAHSKLAQKESYYGTEYNRGLFEVKVKVTRYFKNDPKQPTPQDGATSSKTVQILGTPKSS